MQGDQLVANGDLAGGDRATAGDARGLALQLTGPAYAAAGSCTCLSVARADGGLTTITAGNLTVDVAAAEGTFHDNSTCMSAVSQITIPDGASFAQVCYHNPQPGASVLNASDPLGAYGSSSHPLTLIDNGISVQPVYLPNGANWNDYVTHVPGTDPFQQSGAPCLGTELRRIDCLHGGQLRRVVLTGASTCGPLTGVDGLGVFEWVCRELAGSATLVSIGFVDGAGLKDLVNASSWKLNRVTVSDGAGFSLQTALFPWWNNTVTPAPPSTPSTTVPLPNPSIYTVANNTTACGYTLGANRGALVTLPGVTLSANVAGMCFSQAMVTAGVNFAWIEGDFAGDANLIEIGGGRFGAIHDTRTVGGVNAITLTGGGSHLVTRFRGELTIADTIVVSASSGNILSDVRITRSSVLAVAVVNSFETMLVGGRFGGNGRGVLITTGGDNTLVDVSAHGNILDGIDVQDSPRTALIGIRASNNGEHGIHCVNSLDVNVVASVVAHNALSGITASSCTGLTATHVTAVGHDSDAGLFIDSDNSTLTSIVSAFNETGVALGGPSAGDDNRLGHAAIARNTIPLSVDGNDNNLLGPVLVDVAMGCIITGGSNPNIATDCSGPTQTVVTADPAGAFAGRVEVDDMRNATDSNGTATFGPGMDWLDFEHLHRMWGPDGPAAPTPPPGGACSAGTCRIWDWRLSSTDAVYRNRGDTGNTDNAVLVPGAPCPTEVHGIRTFTNAHSIPQTYLINAFEVALDFVGDEDGLCESSENCLYTPNLGAYQGESFVGGQCTFQNGVVSNVRVRAFTQNGTP